MQEFKFLRELAKDIPDILKGIEVEGLGLNASLFSGFVCVICAVNVYISRAIAYFHCVFRARAPH